MYTLNIIKATEKMNSNENRDLIYYNTIITITNELDFLKKKVIFH